mmetsp:Transcript_23349/g.60898  ORF Transcript_23349/g.60898 Transcript_23349/m.60898 type:complete len:222 (-) Transcript_23349:561-1226(-)
MPSAAAKASASRCSSPTSNKSSMRSMSKSAFDTMSCSANFWRYCPQPVEDSKAPTGSRSAAWRSWSCPISRLCDWRRFASSRSCFSRSDSSSAASWSSSTLSEAGARGEPWRRRSPMDRRWAWRSWSASYSRADACMAAWSCARSCCAGASSCPVALSRRTFPTEGGGGARRRCAGPADALGAPSFGAPLGRTTTWPHLTAYFGSPEVRFDFLAPALGTSS